MKLPAGANRFEVGFGDGVHIACPSWDGSRAWDVWDSRPVRQGAVRLVTVKDYARACVLARKFAASSWIDARDFASALSENLREQDVPEGA